MNAEQFVDWLDGYLDGVRASFDPAIRPPEYLVAIRAKLDQIDTKKEQPFKFGGLTIRSNPNLAPNVVALAHAIGPETARAIRSFGAKQ